MLTGLKATDRCDRCGARAEVLRLFAAGELLFCGHHFREHRKVLDKESDPAQL